MEFTSKSKGIYYGDKKISIKGVNWFGLETEVYCLHGLWSVSMKSLLDFVQKNEFNALRIPFSTEVALGLDTLKCKSINTAANPDLVDFTAGQLMDKLVDACHRRGILIMFDLHRFTGDGSITELWYDNELGYTEAKVIEAWKVIIKRYAKYPNVFAADLKNEPHGRATWGNDNPATDWNKAAERIGNAILEVNPKILIVVEGVQIVNGENSFWGGNLMGVSTHPIKLKNQNKLVYSPHVYGPSVFNQPYFGAPNFPQNMPEIWDKHFGFVEKSAAQTLLLGEVGGDMDSKKKDDVWQKAVFEYLAKNDIDFFYWCLNANSADTKGLLEDDWVTPVQTKLDLLKKTSPNPTKFDFIKPQPLPANPTPVQPPAPKPPATKPQPPLQVTPKPVVKPEVPVPKPQVPQTPPTPPPRPAFRINIVNRNSWFDVSGMNKTIRDVTITNNGKTPLTALNLRLNTSRLHQIWNVDNKNNIIDFPPHIKQNGLAPGESFTFGLISSGATSFTSV